MSQFADVKLTGVFVYVAAVTPLLPEADDTLGLPTPGMTAEMIASVTLVQPAAELLMTMLHLLPTTGTRPVGLSRFEPDTKANNTSIHAFVEDSLKSRWKWERKSKIC